MQVEEGLPNYNDEERARIFRAFVSQLIYYTIVFISDLLIIAYFLNMTRNYVSILSQYYKFSTRKFFAYLAFFTIQLVVTLFRWDIYVTTLLVLKFYYGDKDELFDSYREGSFSRFLIYISKFTPFFIFILVQNILIYFAERN